MLSIYSKILIFSKGFFVVGTQFNVNKVLILIVFQALIFKVCLQSLIFPILKFKNMCKRNKNMLMPNVFLYSIFVWAWIHVVVGEYILKHEKNVCNMHVFICAISLILIVLGIYLITCNMCTCVCVWLGGCAYICVCVMLKLFLLGYVMDVGLRNSSIGGFYISSWGINNQDYIYDNVDNFEIMVVLTRRDSS